MEFSLKSRKKKDALYFSQSVSRLVVLSESSTALNADILQYCNVCCLILHFSPPTGTNTLPVPQYKFPSASLP